MKKELYSILLAGALVGCNSSSGGNDNEGGGGTPVTSGYGYYVLDENDSNDGELSFNFMLAKNGVLHVGYANYDDWDRASLSGYTVVDMSKDSIDTTISMINDDSVVEAHIKLSHFADNMLEVVPASIQIPDLGIELNTQVQYIKPWGSNTDMSLIERNFLPLNSNTSYQYIGNQHIDYVDQNGCETRVQASDSGLSTTADDSDEMHMFALEVLQSSCAYSTDSAGILIIVPHFVNNGYFATLSVQLNESMSEFTGVGY